MYFLIRKIKRKRKHIEPFSTKEFFFLFVSASVRKVFKNTTSELLRRKTVKKTV